MAERDYYDILGVSRTASADEIKAAHRKLVRKYHPDMNKNAPDADKKFKEVQEAYDVLSEPEKRKQYDQFGHAGPQGMPPPGYGGADPFGQYGHGGEWEADPGVRVEDFDFNDFTRGGGGQGDQFGSIFDQLFGSKGAFGRGRKQRERRGEAAETAGHGQSGDVEFPATLSFMQAARGTTLPISIQRPTGRSETIEVKIPAGVKAGSRVRIKGRGQPGPHGPGDLFIVVNVKDHDYYRRDNLDILLDVPISVYEALLGTQVTVPTLDGQVTINIPAGTSSGSKLRIKGAGVQRGADKGDQYCMIKVVVPKDLDREDQAAIATLMRKKPVDARSDVPWR
ncbi:MAG: DnaJ C-terminal domain-containing protein [Tepidisphaeraceae bacterium]